MLQFSKTFKKIAPLVVVGGLVFGLMFWLSRSGERVSETAVKVAELGRGASPQVVVAPQEAVGGKGGAAPFVTRLVNLRSVRVPVKVEGEMGQGLTVAGEGLAPGGLVVVPAEAIAAGAAAAPVAGVSEERLAFAVFEAGVHAVETESLPESVRFISPGYRDAWGYNIALLRAVLKRAFHEFEGIKFELAAPPVVRVQGKEAIIDCAVRLLATYHGRRSYLLGDAKDVDHVRVSLTRAAYGWKVSRLDGLRPLGFEERFFRLLGREVGLPLSDTERLDRDQTCARCKERMRQRFSLPAR